MESVSITSIWHNFHVEWTADGSPTLRLKHGERPESMHHSKGAGSETLYIYGQAMDYIWSTHKASDPMTVWSVGLGLGYNEILWVQRTQQLGFDPFHTTLISFEREPDLVKSFLDWVLERNTSESLKIYDQVFLSLQQSGKPILNLKKLKSTLQKMYEQKRWLIQQTLDQTWLEQQPADIPAAELCLFDAFSQKTSPELWNEEFLNRFIKQALSKKKCLWVTYACTGLLRRTLIQQGFEFTKKPGFEGKRDSTWAIRFQS